MTFVDYASDAREVFEHYTAGETGGLPWAEGMRFNGMVQENPDALFFTEVRRLRERREKDAQKFAVAAIHEVLGVSNGESVFTAKTLIDEEFELDCRVMEAEAREGAQQYFEQGLAEGYPPARRFVNRRYYEILHALCEPQGLTVEMVLRINREA